jgi:hypothetical protein
MPDKVTEKYSAWEHDDTVRAVLWGALGVGLLFAAAAAGVASLLGLGAARGRAGGQGSGRGLARRCRSGQDRRPGGAANGAAGLGVDVSAGSSGAAACRAADNAAATGNP